MKTISDEHLRAYFLGRLTEPEADSLEMECALSAELSEQARAAEMDLNDDYVRGNLSAADLRLYETNYLITEARHKKLRVSAGLWKISSEQEKPISPVASAVQPPIWKMLFGKQNVFRFAFGGAALLLVVCAAAFYLLKSSDNKPDIAEVKEPAESSKPENPALPNPEPQIAQNEPGNQNPKVASTNPGNTEKNGAATQKNPPEVKTVSPPKTIETNKTALAMIVKLLPGSLRDEGEQSVNIAPDVKNLHLLLSPPLEPFSYKTFRAVVKTPENETIFTSPNLKALSFTMPSEKLENRTYIISLEGRNAKNEFESIADYTFRVRR